MLRAYLYHDVRVDLPGVDHVLRCKSQNRADAAVVFHHIGRIVTAAQAQVQGVEDSGADTAQTGGEAVGDTDTLCGQVFQLSLFLCNNRHSVNSGIEIGKCKIDNYGIAPR